MIASGLYHVGVYMRVSQEDSVSIENQKEMLSQFISHMPNWIKTRCYIDDGVSGGNFNRKGFQDMMEDVRAGIINLVLVKDLSRFGRNYLEAGKYLEEILPSLNCRFVAIADNIDTENGENDILPFLNAINDFYLKDVSQRIRYVMKAKAKEGHKLTGSPPYGYKRKPDERHRLIIDADTAKVVQQIFGLRYEGNSYTSIAATLNNEGIKPPRSKIWGLRTIKLMLQNEIYLGNTISLKRGTRSHRDSRTYNRDESEWVKVDNTHTPIISSDIWDAVQNINKASKEAYGTDGTVNYSLFSGLLICPDCGAKMGKTGRGYGCRTYYRSGRAVCSSHYISEVALKEIVSSHIKEIALNLKLNENRMVEKLRVKLIDGCKKQALTSGQLKKELEQLIYTLDNQIDQLFEEKISGVVSGGTFKVLLEKVEVKRLKVEDELNKLVKQAQVTSSTTADIDSWVSAIKEQAIKLEVDRELLVALIEKIEAGARTQVNGQTMQDVRIFYKTVGALSK